MADNVRHFFYICLNSYEAMVQISNPFTMGKSGFLPQEEMLEVTSQRKCLTIGIPKEDDENESRVALTPQAVELLVNNGYTILYERDAGKNASFQNEKYLEAGATMCEDKQSVYAADIILKVGPFSLSEIEYLRERQTVISSFNVNHEAEATIKALLAKKVIAIGFEYIRDLMGSYPVVSSMCEIAGSISIMIAAEYLSNANNGKGIMLGGVTGISPAEVVILGANTAGEFAARTALGLGATVKIFDSNLQRLVDIQRNLGQRIFTSTYHPPVLQKALTAAEVVIGTIPINEAENAFYISEEMVRNMKPGTIVIDLSINQGGCFETSHCTTHKNPTFLKYGITHYCVPNIPARVARTSSIALSNIFAPILFDIGKTGGINPYLKSNFTLRQGVYTFNGMLTNYYISKFFDLPYKNIDLLMAAF